MMAIQYFLMHTICYQFQRQLELVTLFLLSVFLRALHILLYANALMRISRRLAGIYLFVMTGCTGMLLLLISIITVVTVVFCNDLMNM